MAMSNKERQAKWRARLKAQAARSVQDVFRQYMRDFLLSEERLAACNDAQELEIRIEAVDALLAQSDDKLAAVLNALICAWHDDECTTISNARRRAAMARRAVGY